jgi:hypothetical protein
LRRTARRGDDAHESDQEIDQRFRPFGPDDAGDSRQEDSLRQVDDHENPLSREAICHGGAERKSDGCREHSQQADNADTRGATALVCPDGDSEKRRPFDHEETAPRKLEASEVSVTEDVSDDVDLIGQNVFQTPDRRSPLELPARRNRAVERPYHRPLPAI